MLKEMKTAKEYGEKEVAERVYRRVLAKVPVGTYRRSFRRTYTTMSGKQMQMKPWQQRIPGRLKSSLQKLKSKFKDGGWVVMAGNFLAYYARIVEFGTKARRQKTTGRFTGAQRKGRRYLRQAIAYEKGQLIRRIREQVRFIKGMNQ